MKITKAMLKAAREACETYPLKWISDSWDHEGHP